MTKKGNKESDGKKNQEPDSDDDTEEYDTDEENDKEDEEEENDDENDEDYVCSSDESEDEKENKETKEKIDKKLTRSSENIPSIFTLMMQIPAVDYLPPLSSSLSSSFSSRKRKIKEIDPEEERNIEINNKFETQYSLFHSIIPKEIKEDKKNKKIKLNKDGKDEKETEDKQNEYDKHEKFENILLNKSLQQVKTKFTNEIVTLKDILKLDNINEEERHKLINKYIISEYYKTPRTIPDFITEYSKLQSLYSSFKSRDGKLAERRLQLSKISDDEESLVENKIMNLNLNEDYIKHIYSRFNKMSSLPKWDSDRLKIYEWIQTTVSIPFNIFYNQLTLEYPNHIKVINNLKQKLDEKIYGLNTIKEQILSEVNIKLTSPKSTNFNLGLEGSAGTGKTKIFNLLAEVSNIPFDQISLGGVNDVSFLEGHNYTYVGSKCGKIVNSLIKMKCQDGMIFFDEIDKIGKSRYGDEVTGSLLHITDFTQNNKFTDKYIGIIPIDLSNIWFTFSMNNKNEINPILRNRLKIISMPKYTFKDKVEIAKRLLNEIKLILNWNIQDFFIFTEDGLKHILNVINQEDGVRSLKHRLEIICYRLKLIYDMNEYNKLDKLDKQCLKKEDKKEGEKEEKKEEENKIEKILTKLSYSIKLKQYPMVLSIENIDTLMTNIDDSEHMNSVIKSMYT